MHFHFSARLCRAVFFGFRLRKQHKPFNLHTFRPCQPPPVSPHFGCPALPASMVEGCFCQIAPNRAERVPSGLFIHFFQTRAQIATRTATGGNKAFRLPVRPPQFHRSIRLEGYCLFTEIEKDAQLSLKRLVTVRSLPALRSIAPQTPVCSAIPACFQLIVSHLLSQISIFFLVLFSPFSYAKSL